MQEQGFISIRNVRKTYGAVVAVDDISIDIARGEFFSLLGPSGCGKTTLLRMLAGFEFPTAGEIFIDGQPMSSVPPHHRPVNMVFQNYAIFPHLNVRKNIAYALQQDKLPKAEVDRRVSEMLDLIKLPGYENRASHELSGGERQRVALARALIRQPKVLLLDEPLGALDKKLRENMQLELRALQRSVGITFVFVTHDQEEALTMSDRVAVMSQGRYLQIDTPTGLYEAPKSQAVANFIGTINFFDSRVETVRGDHVDVDAGPLGKVTVSKGAQDFAPQEKSILAIRPEKFRMSSDKPADGQSVEGSIENSSYLGDRSFYYVRIPGIADPVAVSSQNAEGGADSGAISQRKVWLRWAKGGAILLKTE